MKDKAVGNTGIHKLHRFVSILTFITVAGCGETWTCESNGSSMYSVSSSGEIGSASKGCSCSQIRVFELKKFGQVDNEAMDREFGC